MMKSPLDVPRDTPSMPHSRVLGVGSRLGRELLPVTIAVRASTTKTAPPLFVDRRVATAARYPGSRCTAPVDDGLRAAPDLLFDRCLAASEAATSAEDAKSFMACAGPGRHAVGPLLNPTRARAPPITTTRI